MIKKNWTPEKKAAMIAKIKATKAERGNPLVKYTLEQVEQMRHLALNRLMRYSDIMEKYNVSKSTLSKILNYQIYSDSNPTHLKAFPDLKEE